MTNSNKVEFRLKDPDLLARLDAAAAAAGTTRNDYARELLLAGLTNGSLRSELAKVAESITSMVRRDLGNSTTLILSQLLFELRHQGGSYPALEQSVARVVQQGLFAAPSASGPAGGAAETI